MISNATKCSILRWIHIIFGIPILGYIYGPVSEVQQYTAAVRFVSFLPVIVLSGFGCGKAMSFDLFQKIGLTRALQRTAAALSGRESLSLVVRCYSRTPWMTSLQKRVCVRTRTFGSNRV